jgi:hypothetical protein
MAIELSTITFTDQADVVPASGVERIVNTDIANTLAGNDIITGVGDGSESSIFNSGTINTAEGNDRITGTHNQTQDSPFAHGIFNSGSIDTGDGNDIINGDTTAGIGNGIVNGGSINTGNGNDRVIGTAYNSTDEYYAGFTTSGDFNTGDGNDVITGVGQIGISYYGKYNYPWDSNEFQTGEGNDIIMGSGKNIGFVNYGGSIITGGGNDIIVGRGGSVGIENSNNPRGSGGYISTGEGDDIIIGSGQIGISMYEGFIDTGHGNDSIIANGGFDGYGSVQLGYGNDYLNGFGRGYYFGTGNYYQPPPDEDTLELTSGSYTVSYTVEPWGTATNFTKDGIIMKTFQFEKLIAGSTTYDFSSLTEGQTIVVA